MRTFSLVIFTVVLMMETINLSEADARDVEITPFAGYTWGGQFTDSITDTTLNVDEGANYGVMVDINMEDTNQEDQAERAQVELYFSHQATSLRTDNGLFTGNPLFDLHIDYYHIGGTYGEDYGRVWPFLVGTLGVTHMVPQGPGLDSLTKFSLSLGGGVKLFATDRVGLRLEGRWFGTLFNGSSSVFCSDGKCAINVQGDMFSQFVANAGIIITF
jgi:opacity protein-like surface antigen